MIFSSNLQSRQKSRWRKGYSRLKQISDRRGDGWVISDEWGDLVTGETCREASRWRCQRGSQILESYVLMHMHTCTLHYNPLGRYLQSSYDTYDTKMLMIRWLRIGWLMIRYFNWWFACDIGCGPLKWVLRVAAWFNLQESEMLICCLTLLSVFILYSLLLSTLKW